jgi:hypothetical protein
MSGTAAKKYRNAVRNKGGISMTPTLMTTKLKPHKNTVMRARNMCGTAM